MDIKKEIAVKMISHVNKSPEIKEPETASGRILLEKLSALGKKRLWVFSGTGICRLIVVIFILLSLGMFFDWIFDFDIKIRALLLLIYTATLGCITYSGIIKNFITKPDREDLALMVEKSFPVFKSRLISSVQFINSDKNDDGITGVLINKLIQETESIARPLNFLKIIDTKPLKTGLISAVITLIVTATAFYQTKEYSVILLKRLFLSSIEVPRKTRVEVITGNKIIGRGDSVSIQAMASGIIPTSGQLLTYYNSGRTAEYIMQPDETNKTLFSVALDNLQESFDYRVKLFDGASKRFRIEVVTRPDVAFIECIQQYPDYTGLGELKRNPGDLGLLAGSKLKLTITATKPVKSGRIRLAGLEKNLPLQVDNNSNKVLHCSFEIPPANLTGFSIFLTDNNGVESKDPTLYKIDIIPDKPPGVKIIYPERKEELYTRLARVLIGFEASDDFGISAIKIHYKIDTINNGAEKIIELDLNNEKPRNLRRRFEWEISKLEPPPAEGSTIEYWVEAIDLNDKTGPGIGLSEHYLAKIVSEAEKRAELMNRISEYIGNLGEVANEQERLSQSIGEIILQKTK